MAFKALDDGGLLYFWSKIKNRLLPQTTSTDNGKVLAVENGAWTISKLGQPLFVDLQSSTKLSETYEAIVSALRNNQLAVLRIGAMGGYQFGLCDFAGNDVVFSTSVLIDNEIYKTVVKVNAEDVVQTSIYHWPVTAN